MFSDYINSEIELDKIAYMVMGTEICLVLLTVYLSQFEAKAKEDYNL